MKIIKFYDYFRWQKLLLFEKVIETTYFLLFSGIWLEYAIKHTIWVEFVEKLHKQITKKLWKLWAMKAFEHIK